MSTITTATRLRRRGHSLYFTAPLGPDHLSTLPNELVLHILFLALDPALYTLNKRLAALVDLLLYTSVELATPRALALFLRKPPAFLAAHVKTLAVTAPAPLTSSAEDDLVRVVRACVGARTLALPASLGPFLARPFTPAGPAPFELTFHSYVDVTPKDSLSFYLPAGVAPKPATRLATDTAMLAALTHLRFCEPAGFYVSPTAAIEALAPALMGTLTHLQLARRARANEENDIAFTGDVRALLDHTNFKCVVVSVFPSTAGTQEDVKASYVWGLLEEMKKEVGPGRLLVLKGVYGESTDAGFWQCAKEASSPRL